MPNHEGALAALHKQHAAVRDNLNEIYAVLALKVEETRNRKLENARQDELHQQEKVKWTHEVQGLNELIVSYKLLIEEHNSQTEEMGRTLIASEQKGVILQETLKEREQFIVKMLAEKEAATKVRVDSHEHADFCMSEFERQQKFASEQLEQVRMTATYLDSYSSDISKAINELAKEVRSLEESQGTCEAMMLSISNNKIPPKSMSALAHKALIQSLCDQVGALQSQNIDLGNQLDTSEAMLSNTTQENVALHKQVHELVQKLHAQQHLVGKYQESSLCGTQTIDAMQLSIATLTTEHDCERHTLLRQIEELSASMMDSEAKKQLEMDALHTKLLDMESELQDKTARIGQLEATVIQLQADNEAAAQSCKKSPIEPPSVKRTAVGVPKTPHAVPAAFVAEVAPTVSIVDPPSTCSSARGPESTGTSVAVIPDVCLACREEPFGFMVRCQKCKQQFHAGCVRSKRQKTSRVGCYVFVCEPCESAPSTSSMASSLAS
ncbi:Aste57867_18813 [Aphanomyces stellatus]|uniref:Aste57867_18813 protein n=1 Tax=Aphanomyces stellatus TaxID=120398 RepID=A0A485LBY1_9STRA|nr:hypothetical protein As57867_018749 [Aphanomyces stellatus]VFT95547.1 Aste57867_18813 [Aphanomyces stellatus]